MNAPDPATFTIGYALDSVLARTDHSLVFAAEARRTARLVAIKVPHDSEGADALRREIQVLRGLRHPHIVELVEGTVAGHPWMVTPLAATSLEAATATHGRFAADEVAGVVVTIAAALQFVHRHRLVHGDVKPANILLCDDGRPLLADFGSAHPVGTAPAQFTPTYFADDGAEGDVAALARSALHALGDGTGARDDALRAVLREFARAGDRPDVLVDAVVAIVPEPQWPRVDGAETMAAAGASTIPFGPRPPRPYRAHDGDGPAPRRRPRWRLAWCVAAAVIAVGAIDVARERHSPSPAPAAVEHQRP